MYRVRWENEFCIDSFDRPSMDEAIHDALDLLLEWESQERYDWKSTQPSQEQIDRWNYMIDECHVGVFRLDGERLVHVWNPTEDDFKRVGWMYFDDLDRK